MADVFESFCKHIKDTHKLNTLFFFYGAPSLSYNAMLYHFKDDDVHPVLLSEPNMAVFFTQMIRGALHTSAQDWQRQVRMRRSSTCLDANNNLYVWTMSQKLPTMGSSG